MHLITLSPMHCNPHTPPPRCTGCFSTFDHLQIPWLVGCCISLRTNFDQKYDWIPNIWCWTLFDMMYINKWFLNATILIFTIIMPILTFCFLRFRTHSEMYGVHPKPIPKWGLVQFCPQCTYSHLHYHNTHLDILSMKTEKNESQGDLSAIHETCRSFFVEQNSIGHISKVLTFM